MVLLVCWIASMEQIRASARVRTISVILCFLVSTQPNSFILILPRKSGILLNENDCIICTYTVACYVDSLSHIILLWHKF